MSIGIIITIVALVAGNMFLGIGVAACYSSLRIVRQEKSEVHSAWNQSSDRRNDAKKEFFEELERITDKYKYKC